GDEKVPHRLQAALLRHEGKQGPEIAADVADQPGKNKQGGGEGRDEEETGKKGVAERSEAARAHGRNYEIKMSGRKVIRRAGSLSGPRRRRSASTRGVRLRA